LLIGTIVVLTIHGFPAVRYIAVVAPCYGALAVCALRAFGLPAVLRNLVSGVLVLAAGLNTFGLIARDYAPRQDHAWPQVDGIEEFARHVGNWTGPVRFVTFPFPKTNESNLYLRMLTNSNARWLTAQEFERELDSADRMARPADRFFLVAAAADAAAIAGWNRRGFGILSRFDARSGAGPIVLLGRPTRRFDSTGLLDLPAGRELSQGWDLKGLNPNPISVLVGSPAGAGDREERRNRRKDPAGRPTDPLRGIGVSMQIGKDGEKAKNEGDSDRNPKGPGLDRTEQQRGERQEKRQSPAG
jgi:hypothetical protein